MACASTSRPEVLQDSTKLEFIGPAGDEFNSLEDLAEFSLTNYWLDKWPDKGSIIIPPVFRYMNPEVSDYDLEQLKNTNQMETKKTDDAGKQDQSVDTEPKPQNPDPKVKDRLSNEAEKVIYDILYQLVKQNFQAPMIVIHNLDFNTNRNRLRKIFNVPMDIDLPGEFDFLLIGIEFGIVVIEVKGGKFEAKSDFADKSMRLPNKYYEGLDQLRSVHLDKEKGKGVKDNAKLSLLTLLKNYTNCNEIPVISKVMVTPNLPEIRYETWKNGLNEKSKEGNRNAKKSLKDVENLTKNILQLFEDDFSKMDTDTGKSVAVMKLCKLLGANNTISKEMYQKYGRLLVGIATMNTSVSIKQKQENVSKSNEIMRESALIDNIMSIGLKLENISEADAIKEEKALFNKIMLKTPEQLQALNAQGHQLILGTAGTGKTIVLREKLLELWNKGERVRVLAPESYLGRYKDLFSCVGKGEMYYDDNWYFAGTKQARKGIHPFLHEFMPSRLETMPTKQQNWLTSILLPLQPYTSETLLDHVNRMFHALDEAVSAMSQDTSHLIIDDHLETWNPTRYIDLIVASLYSMYYFIAKADNLQFHTNDESTLSIWVALNLHQVQHEDSYTNSYNDTVNQVFRTLRDHLKARDVSVTVLKQILRNSKEVCRSIYDDMRICWPGELAPVMGSSIAGSPTDKIVIQCSSTDEVENKLCDELGNIFSTYGKMKIGVISNLHGDLGYDLIRFLKYFFQFTQASNVDFFYWHDVASLEWPLVIYINPLPENYEASHTNGVEYERFRAVSRAMVKVIEIKVTYPCSGV